MTERAELTLADVIDALRVELGAQSRRNNSMNEYRVFHHGQEVAYMDALSRLETLRAAIKTRRDGHRNGDAPGRWYREDELDFVLGPAPASAMAELEHVAQTLDYTQRGTAAELTDNDAEALKDLDIFRRRANSIELGPTPAAQPGKEEE